MSARYVDYWEDLEAMPEEGPFIVCGGPVGAQVDRIEQVRGPDGVGCPIALHMEIYSFMEKHNIPRSYKGASKLNELYHQGRFRWDGIQLRIKEENDA